MWITSEAGSTRAFNTNGDPYNHALTHDDKMQMPPEIHRKMAELGLWV